LCKNLLSIKKGFFKKKFFEKKQCFSSTPEFQSKMLFFLTLKKLNKNSEHRFLIDNIPPWSGFLDTAQNHNIPKNIYIDCFTYSSTNFIHVKSGIWDPCSVGHF
jgi:hypothetical protein